MSLLDSIIGALGSQPQQAGGQTDLLHAVIGLLELVHQPRQRSEEHTSELQSL